MKSFNKLIIFSLSLVFIFLSGCSDLRNNLTLKKKKNTDEFLVEKKNPLVYPPDYKDLPKPISEEKKIENKEIDLSKIFKNSNKVKPKTNSGVDSSLEDSIRKKIGKN